MNNFSWPTNMASHVNARRRTIAAHKCFIPASMRPKTPAIFYRLRQCLPSNRQQPTTPSQNILENAETFRMQPDQMKRKTSVHMHNVARNINPPSATTLPIFCAYFRNTPTVHHLPCISPRRIIWIFQHAICIFPQTNISRAHLL